MKRKKTLLVIFCLAIILFMYLSSRFLILKEIFENRIHSPERIRLVDVLHSSGTLDASKNYKLFYHVGLVRSYQHHKVHSLGIATQCSFNKISSVQDLSAFWTGSISVAIYTPPQYFTEAVEMIIYFQTCYKQSDKISIHLVTEFNLIVKHNIHVKLRKCGDHIKNEISTNYNWSLPYPVNLLRNVAISQLKETYYLLIDVDMLPSKNLREAFVNFLQNYEWTNLSQTALILPTFEIKHHFVEPLNKKKLIQLVASKTARQFYRDPCKKCQNCVNYWKWLQLPLNPGLNLAYSIEWTDPCEPFYITNSAPMYDESFKQYGFNRISQLCEVHVANFRFFVLDNAFLIHKGFKSLTSFHLTKEFEQNGNRDRYQKFKNNLKLKYPQSVKSC